MVGSELVVDLLSGGLEVFDRIRAEWCEFLDRVENDPLFWRPEWILASIRARSPKAKVMVITIRRQGRLCGVLPLKLEKAKFGRLSARKLSTPLTMPGVGVEIICASDTDPQEMAGAIWDYLKSLKSWDVLELSSVIGGANIERLSDLARQDGYCTGGWNLPPVAFFAIPQGAQALQDLGKFPRHRKLRAKVKGREAKLAALGSVQLARIEKAGRDMIQRFYEMEANGWKGKEKSAILSSTSRHQFFDEVTKEAEKLGYLCLYSLELDGRSIAAHIGFTYRGRYWAAKSTYDENYRDYVPGHLIVKAILADCVKRGISEYIMGVREDWKMEWTEETRARSLQCIFNKGIWPRCLYAAHFSLREWYSKSQAMLKGIQGSLGLRTVVKRPPKSDEVG